MAIHVLKGTGAPSSTPTKFGQHYVDEQNGVSYISTGTDSSADWKVQIASDDSRLTDSRTCNNTFDDAATSRGNLGVYSTSEVDNKVVGLYDHKGAYDADTNSPDLDTSPSGIKKADAYTVSVAGTFFTEAVEVGDVLISDQDDPTTLAHWTRVNKNISFGTSAGTACEGNDSRLHTHANKATLDNITAAYTSEEASKLSGIAAGAEVNPDLISQAEAEAGTATDERIWSAERVSQAIAAKGGKANVWDHSYGTTAGDFIEVSPTEIYTKLDTFVFSGSANCGTPTKIYGLLSSSSGSLLTYQWRVYDKTNSLVIAEGTTVDLWNTSLTLHDFGTVSNIPAGVSEFELQVKEVPSSAGKARCHSLVAY